MSRVILKFELDPLIVDHVQKVEIPSMEYDPNILDVQFLKGEKLVFWVETNILYLTEKKTEKEEFILRFTGCPFEMKPRKYFSHLKTLQHPYGLIYHIYKRLWNTD